MSALSRDKGLTIISENYQRCHSAEAFGNRLVTVRLSLFLHDLFTAKFPGVVGCLTDRISGAID